MLIAVLAQCPALTILRLAGNKISDGFEKEIKNLLDQIQITLNDRKKLSTV